VIISASRRTDIPAFYPRWLIHRIRAGYCVVPNPFNCQQAARISLRPEDVEVIAFWTRNPRPLFPYLKELDERGFRYYFQYTLMNNPRKIDPASPAVEAAIATFQELARRVGPARVIWRYDPLIFTTLTDSDFHLQQYTRIASALHGSTFRSVISIMDEYPKAQQRLQQMSLSGAQLLRPDISTEGWARGCIEGLVSCAASNGMEIVSCAEAQALLPLGVRAGKCIDDEYIQRVFGIQVDATKDPHQRKLCGCVRSKDIGMYDSCLFGCRYCYATQNFATARKNYTHHQPDSPSLIGWHEAD